MLRWLHINPSSTDLDRSKAVLEGFVWSHQSIKGLVFPHQFALTSWFLASGHFFTFFFVGMSTNPFHQSYFLWRHRFSSLIKRITNVWVGVVKNEDFWIGLPIQDRQAALKMISCNANYISYVSCSGQQQKKWKILGIQQD